MFALLLGAGVLYLLLGSHGEALVLFAFACFSVAIAIIQEGRSERVLEALRDLTSPRALVMRDGEQTRIPGQRGRARRPARPRGRRPCSGRCHVDFRRRRAGRRESCSRESPCPCASAYRRTCRRRRHGREAMTCLLFFSGTLIVTGGGLARRHRDRTARARSARSDTRSLASSPSRPPLLSARPPVRHGLRHRRTVGERLRGAALRPAARRLARRACSAASRSRCRCCPRSSRWS